MIGDNITQIDTDVDGWPRICLSRGFTLMEMLVALSLFSVVVTITTNIFFSFQQASRKTENLEVVTAGARLIMERIVREVREGTIDYAWYADHQPALNLTQSQNSLSILNREGKMILFAFDSTGHTLQLQVGTDTENLSSSKLAVRDLSFKISPTKDPFVFDTDSGKYFENAQPRVTVLLSLDNNLPANHANYVHYDLQTTISSRVYQR